MRKVLSARPLVIGLALALALSLLFVVLVLSLRTEMRGEVHEKMIGRAGDILLPLTQSEPQLNPQDRAATAGPGPLGSNDELSEHLLASLGRPSRQEGLLAMAVFKADGTPLLAVPASQVFVDLPLDDFLHLSSQGPVSRFHPAFDLAGELPGLVGGESGAEARPPVLEVLLPLHRQGRSAPIGFVRYHFDARHLAQELDALDAKLQRQTLTTLATGLFLIWLILGTALFALQRAQLAIDERNRRLSRATTDLTLATKVSALGQITSNLVHGLQGPVAGLREELRRRAQDPEWRGANDYAERLQAIVQETVGLLADMRTHSHYELSGQDLAELILERNLPAARERGVNLSVRNDFHGRVDNHQGSLLCLIAGNLIQNALKATASGANVSVHLLQEGSQLQLLVADEGPGIPPELVEHLFEPGRSGRPGGTGLGLAISRLLAAQIGGELCLQSSDGSGSRFRLSLPLVATPSVRGT